MTGNVASQAGGGTFHSEMGVRTGAGSPAELVAHIRRIPALVEKLRNLSAICLAEAAMLGGDLFCKCDLVLREIRGIDLFFGGIQVILEGDFHQVGWVVGSLA